MKKINETSSEDRIIIKNYYLYHKFLKEKLNKHLNESSLKRLLEIVDPLFEYFSYDHQKIFIKINIMLVLLFLRSEKHALQVLSAKRIAKEKGKPYLQASRRIQHNFLELVNQLKCSELFKK